MLKHYNLLPYNPLIPSILKACGGLHCLKPDQQLHVLTILNGWSLHPFIASSLILFYAKCGEIEIVCKVFDEMPEKDLVAGSALVSGMGWWRCFETVEVFKEMCLAGFKADGMTVSSVLSTVGELGDLGVGVMIHGYVWKNGLGEDKWVVSVLIDMYEKCGSTVEMMRVFDEMGCKDVGARNALISGFSRNGLTDEALEAWLLRS
ncbi:pentatricopeptide repeat-containing protein [Tanacetum coccineum]|uniref:Pentatricopeptide repeat-containing protein n=1 Tax=Tanacetum coccineum TaxID=301880 RepID=A0ABQ5CH95_9ASTR